MPKQSGLRGSYFQRGKTYTISFPLPAHLDERDDNGKRRYKKIAETFPDEQTALARLIELNHQYQTGALSQPDQKRLADYLDEWLATKTHLAYNSQLIYRRECDLISRFLGNYELRQIDTLIIERWHAQMRQDGSVSTSGASRAHRRLSHALRDAVNAGRIPVNYAARVKGPKHRRQRHDAWEPHEARQFVAWISEPGNVSHLRVLGPSYWITLLTTGLRLSEALALRWSDAELPWNGSGSISVERTAALVDDGVYAIKDVAKTDASVRTVPIPASLVELLRAHKAKQNRQRLKMGGHWRDLNLIWTTWNGSLVSMQSARTQLRQLCKRAGMRRIPIHGMRHTAASLMQEHGVPLVTVQEILGHQDPSTTAGIYGHASSQSKVDAVERLDALLRGAN